MESGSKTPTVTSPVWAEPAASWAARMRSFSAAAADAGGARSTVWLSTRARARAGEWVWSECVASIEPPRSRTGWPEARTDSAMDAASGYGPLERVALARQIEYHRRGPASRTLVGPNEHLTAPRGALPVDPPEVVALAVVAKRGVVRRGGPGAEDDAVGVAHQRARGRGQVDDGGPDGNQLRAADEGVRKDQPERIGAVDDRGTERPAAPPRGEEPVGERRGRPESARPSPWSPPRP